MRSRILAFAVLASVVTPTLACDLIVPRRPPTLAEKLGGVKEIFGGTVVGYVNSDGTELLGPPPKKCFDDQGWLDWLVAEKLPACKAYLDVTEALFRVDVPIVGTATGEIASYGMHWGDGDCDQDFRLGEKWLIAGPYVIEQLDAPIRPDEIATLQRLAALPAFDMKKLYR